MCSILPTGHMLDGRAQRLEDDLVGAQRELHWQREEVAAALAARDRQADEMSAVLEQRGNFLWPLGFACVVCCSAQDMHGVLNSIALTYRLLTGHHKG